MAKFTKHTNKDGSRNKSVAKRIVRMRDKDNLSWRNIAAELEIAPRTVRRMYDEVKGEGAHFSSRPLVGGRPAPESGNK